MEEIYKFYGPEKILETIEWSKQLDKRDKDFTRLFLKSHLLHAALQVLPELSDFYLVGGTALALQLGHRNSIDIDLFTKNDLDAGMLGSLLKTKFDVR